MKIKTRIFFSFSVRIHVKLFFFFLKPFLKRNTFSLPVIFQGANNFTSDCNSEGTVQTFVACNVSFYVVVFAHCIEGCQSFQI